MSPRNKLLRKLQDKEYRDEFLSTTVRGSIAHQVQALRRNLEKTQAEFADVLGKKQNQVSRLEDDEYSGSVQTLIEVASSLGVGLLVRFVDYAEFIDRTEDMSDKALAVQTVAQTMQESAAAEALSNLRAEGSRENAGITWASPSVPGVFAGETGSRGTFVWQEHLYQPRKQSSQSRRRSQSPPKTSRARDPKPIQTSIRTSSWPISRPLT